MDGWVRNFWDPIDALMICFAFDIEVPSSVRNSWNLLRYMD